MIRNEGWRVGGCTWKGFGRQQHGSIEQLPLPALGSGRQLGTPREGATEREKEPALFCSYLRNIFNTTAAGRLTPGPLTAVPYHISGVLHVRGLNLFCGAFFSVTCHGCRGVRERGKRKRSRSLSRSCSRRQKLVACKPPSSPPTLPLPQKVSFSSNAVCVLTCFLIPVISGTNYRFLWFI